MPRNDELAEGALHAGDGFGAVGAVPGLLVLEQLPAWQHALVKDTANEDAILDGAIDDNVLLVFDTPIALANLIAWATDA